MSKAKKVGLPRRSKRSGVKTMEIIKKNNAILKKYINEAKS